MQSRQAQAEAIANLYQPPAVGRPSDIGDPIIVQQFLDAIADGNYIETACHLVGLSKVTVYAWLKRGEDGEQPFAMFANSLKGAEARAEAKMLANVRRASELPQFWAAGMTVLERRHPDRWGKRQDDQQVPRVVVQIGVSGGEVNVGLIASPSPSLSDDLHRLSPSVNSVQGRINRDYVNEPQTLSVSVPTESDRQFPAVESPGGPYRGAPLAGGQRKPGAYKGKRRRPAQKEKGL